MRAQNENIHDQISEKNQEMKTSSKVRFSAKSGGQPRFKCN